MHCSVNRINLLVYAKVTCTILLTVYVQLTLIEFLKPKVQSVAKRVTSSSPCSSRHGTTKQTSLVFVITCHQYYQHAASSFLRTCEVRGNQAPVQNWVLKFSLFKKH
jgi:hypothetical protein